MRSKIAALVAPIFLGGLIFVISGCTPPTKLASETTTSEGNTSQAPSGSVAARADQALVRFINADPQGRAMNLSTRNGGVFSGVKFKEVTPYKAIPAQAQQFTLKTEGGDMQLASDWVELFAGHHYTVIVIPRKTGPPNLTAMYDLVSKPKEGQAKVRLINATAHVDDLNLASSATKEIIQKGIDTSQATRFSDVAPGDYEIRASTAAAPPMLSDLKVEPGHLYTFVVMGTPGDLEVVTIRDELKP